MYLPCGEIILHRLAKSFNLPHAATRRSFARSGDGGEGHRDGNDNRDAVDNDHEKSIFADISASTEVLTLSDMYAKDKSKLKCNLSDGLFRNSEGVPFVMPIVRRVACQIACDDLLSYVPLPVLGSANFCKLANELVLGKAAPVLREQRVMSLQALSGFGALRLGAQFLRIHLKRNVVLIPFPTWPGHMLAFRSAGFRHIVKYNLWNAKKRRVNYDAVLTELAKAPDGAVVLLHACCQNPTGFDPTQEQWMELAEVIRCKQLLPFFDVAYLGFGDDLDTDAWALRYFVAQGFELFISQTFSKLMGLHSERVGCLSVVFKDCRHMELALAQFRTLARINCSVPPAHGCCIVEQILDDEQNRGEWVETIDAMRERIVSTRQALFEALQELGTPGNWEHIVKQKGLFAFTGLSPAECKKLHQMHIYLTTRGRINVSSLNERNIKYVASCINEVVLQSLEEQQPQAAGELLKSDAEA